MLLVSCSSRDVRDDIFYCCCHHNNPVHLICLSVTALVRAHLRKNISHQPTVHYLPISKKQMEWE